MHESKNFWSILVIGTLLIAFPAIAAPEASEQSLANPQEQPQVPAGISERKKPEALTDVIVDDSVEFPLGKLTRPNMIIRSEENPELGVSLGIRYQGTGEVEVGDGPTTYDFYARRARFEISTFFSKNSAFSADLRADRTGQEERSVRFELGDAYFVTKKLWNQPFLNFRAYRTKVDVSRSQTAKSSWLIYYDRASVTEAAAQYVNENRRATNIQLFGSFDDKVHYQLAFGDGIKTNQLRDASGVVLSEGGGEILRQDPMFGGKLILSPIPGWEEKVRTETYFGQGQHAEIGLGVFRTANIVFSPTGGADTFDVDHTLLNFEASAHHRGAFAQFEFFRFFETVESFAAPTPNVGLSNGWYILTEYVFTDLGFIAPFFRYQYWDLFEGTEGNLLITKAAGINWYLRGYTTRVGFVVDVTDAGPALDTDSFSSGTTLKVISQFHF